MCPADRFDSSADSPQDESLSREIAYLETWLEYRPAVAPIVLSRLGELGRELRADLPRLLAERKVKANVARLRAERDAREQRRHLTARAASVAALIATAPSVVIAAPAVAEEAQLASGEAATGTLLLRVMDAVSGKPLPGVKLVTVEQEIVAVTDDRGQAPVPARYAGEGVLSLEREGYPIVLIQGAKLAGRSLVAMKPFSTGPSTASRKRPTTTAKARPGLPVIQVPTPPSSSAIDEAMAALRGAPAAPEAMAAAPVQPEAPVALPVEPKVEPKAEPKVEVAAQPAPPAPEPVAAAPEIKAEPVAPAVVAEAPVPQAAPSGDYGPVEAPVEVAAAPAGLSAPIKAAEKPAEKPAAKPVVAVKKSTPKVKTAVVAKAAQKSAPAPKVAAKPVPRVEPVAIAHTPVPAARPLLPIAPPIVSVSDVRKLSADGVYGPDLEAPVVQAPVVAEAPAKVAAPAPKPVVVALKKPIAKASKPAAPKPVELAAALPVDLPVDTSNYGPEPEVRPVLPLVPAPELPVVAAAPAAVVAPVEAPVETPLAAPVEAPIEAPVTLASAEPIQPTQPVSLPVEVAAEHHANALVETSPAPTRHETYGPTQVASAPHVTLPGQEDQQAPLTKPAAKREPVASKLEAGTMRSVVVPKKAIKPRQEKTAYYKVRPGDSLSLIARDLLGDLHRWPELYAANRDVLTDPAWLQVGLSLKVPKAGAAPVMAVGKKTYVVRHGDSLSLIAKRQLGDIKKWADIYAANRHAIADPALIFPGQRLQLPVPVAAAMPPLSWANLQATVAPPGNTGMGGFEPGDEPKLAFGGDVKYSAPEEAWDSLVSD